MAILASQEVRNRSEGFPALVYTVKFVMREHIRCASRAIYRIRPVASASKRPPISFLQQLRIARHITERLLEIMIRRVCKSVQVFIRATKACFDAFLLVDIGECSKPSNAVGDTISGRDASAKEPTVSAGMAVRKTAFGFVGFLHFDGGFPTGQKPVQIIRVNHGTHVFGEVMDGV